MSTFVAFWPIADPDATLDDLVAEALSDLPRVAAACHARLTSWPEWAIASGRAVPGASAYRRVLTCRAQALDPPLSNLERARRRERAAYDAGLIGGAA